MIVFAIAFLSSLALANYWIGRRFLYPPVVFCSVWAADLTLVWLAGDFFYPLADETLAVFCLGGMAFSVGASIALLVPQETVVEQPLGKTSERSLSLALLIVACFSPFILIWIVKLASEFQTPSWLLSARMAMLEADQSGDPAPILFGNIVTLSIIVAMVAFLQKETGRKRSLLAIAFALLLNIAEGGRAGIVVLLLSLLCIDWIRNDRLRWKPLAIALSAVVIISGAMAIAVQKGEARADVPLAENLTPVFEGLVSYASGGIVAFDRVVREPSIVVHNWQASRFFLQVAAKLGAHVDVPSQHADFVAIGPGGLSQNVYTMYFAYFDLGPIAMPLLVVLDAFLVTLFYRKAIAGSRVSIILYSFLFASILLTPFSEMWLLGLNFSLKIFLLAWLVYRFPGRLHQVWNFLVGWNSVPAWHQASWSHVKSGEP